jgi:hypothetical protein
MTLSTAVRTPWALGQAHHLREPSLFGLQAHSKARRDDGKVLADALLNVGKRLLSGICNSQ